MAFRLAAHVAGRIDVDQMLTEIDPGLFDEWIAYHSIEPIDDSHVRETVTLAGTAICRGLGMDVEPHHLRIDTAGSGPKRLQQKSLSVTGLKANLAAFVAVHNSSCLMQ